MPYNFYPVNRDQLFLLPPSMREWLPADHLVWFVIDAVGQMDLSKFYARYRLDGHGATAFEPSMMVTLLLYGYCVGQRSSRQIQRLCEQDAAFRIASGNLKPGFNAIARFRRTNMDALSGLFLDVLKLCKAAGLAKVGIVALDGTKVKANAALDANREYAWLVKEVKKMLAEADSTDHQEDGLFGADRRGDELPEDLRDPKTRLARMKECMERLECDAAAAAALQQAKIDQRAREESEAGVVKNGRKPAPPDATPDPKATANVTDPDSRIMKTRQGYVQGYNAQAVVNEHQVILSCAVTQDANDVQQLHPMIDRTQANLRAAGIAKTPGVLLADAGYWSEKNMLEAADGDPELIIATLKDYKQRVAARMAPPPRGRMPKNMNVRDWMERKLLTKRGRSLYKLRGAIVEPIFGQTKDVRDCDNFLMRGIYLADGEWTLICTTHNMLKCWRKGGAAR